MEKIVFNRPSFVGDELAYIKEAIGRAQLSGDGHFTFECQKLLNRIVGCPASLLTHSCTAALEMAAILCDIGPGDEVIMPSFTFVSTANAVVLRGGVPVFVDVRPDTLNLDERLVEAAITPKTRAIFTVHYGGVCSALDELREIADAYGLWLVEDAAQALGSKYKGRPAGSVGHLATLSFHETKNVICGEGGALLINDSTLAERAEIIREKGTNRKRFFRGQVDKYTWVDVGSSFLPGELIAAYLYAQLQMVDEITQQRLAMWRRYQQAFAGLPRELVQLPHIPNECEHNGHLFYMLLADIAARDAFIAAMKAADVMTPFHYVPLHSAPAGKKFARTHGPMRVTNDISARLVRLPLFYTLGDDIERVIELATAQLRAQTA